MDSEIYDPSVVVSKALQMAKRPESLSGKVVGLYDNTKDRADTILEAVGEDLLQKDGVKTLVARRGVHYSRPAPIEIVEEMARQCDVVVLALGG